MRRQRHMQSLGHFIQCHPDGEHDPVGTDRLQQRADCGWPDVAVKRHGRDRSNVQLDWAQRIQFIGTKPIDRQCDDSGLRHIQRDRDSEWLRLFASHDFADNAQYWLAEVYYDQKDYPTAVREFRRVMEKYPQGNKVPDALLKLGFCHLALGSTEVARQTLEQVVRSYPGHGAAALATAKLADLGLGGEASR